MARCSVKGGQDLCGSFCPVNPQIPLFLPFHNTFLFLKVPETVKSFLWSRQGLKGEEKEKTPFMGFSLTTSLPSVLLVTNGQKEQRAQQSLLSWLTNTSQAARPWCDDHGQSSKVWMEERPLPQGPAHKLGYPAANASGKNCRIRLQRATSHLNV